MRLFTMSLVMIASILGLLAGWAGPSSAQQSPVTAIDVLLAAPTVKCLINAYISAGALVGIATDAAGRIVERGQAATTTAHVPILGIALQNGGTTNALVEVMLQPFSANLQSA